MERGNIAEKKLIILEKEKRQLLAELERARNRNSTMNSMWVIHFLRGINQSRMNTTNLNVADRSHGMANTPSYHSTVSRSGSFAAPYNTSSFFAPPSSLRRMMPLKPVVYGSYHASRPNSTMDSTNRSGFISPSASFNRSISSLYLAFP